jgi:hypothetical protein
MRALAIVTLVLAIALALIFRLRPRQPVPDRRVARVLHVVFVVTLALMALSSIFMLAIGSSMHGWMLMLHMSIAPLFSLAIAVLALLWAERTSELLRLVLLSAIVTIVTAMFLMMTWFGSEWQRTLLNVHRVSSMILLIAAAAQAGRLLLARNIGNTGNTANTGNADAAGAGD